MNVWHCVVENELRHDGSTPWQCESGSSTTPGHEACRLKQLVSLEELDWASLEIAMRPLTFDHDDAADCALAAKDWLMRELRT